MRKDVLEGVLLHIMNEIHPNFAALAKQYNCDYRTVKRYYEAGLTGDLDKLRERKPSVPPLLHGFEEIIRDKLELNCSAASIFYFLGKKDYKGSYTTIKRYCRKYREEKVQKATIRIETTPGLSAQVDWKENVKMVSRDGEVFYFNIFLYILGYSRMKYLELTFDRTQPTVFQCLVNAFEYCGNGIPQEIWFDNMKTVVDRSKSQFTQTVFNEKFRQFAKDAGFHPIACRPFRPQTKGKVEALARTVERLMVFNYEFTDVQELKQIIYELMQDLNGSVSQAIHNKPTVLLKEELPILAPIHRLELLSYVSRNKRLLRKVSMESMVQYQNAKYSVPVKYIGKEVTLDIRRDNLFVWYGDKCIRTHPISEKALNYQREDSLEILRSDVFKYLEDEELERFVDDNLHAYDDL
ncbi:IS21 family transposase [Listeria monocytogenes]|uniref:Pli0003 protein n=1 Tax=Listeria innocua serovar 6a (strain ATCC BAA-680 / CLIP 11262) TaxID=272626 RepID=Q926P9_LISIN|nr:MULTISPECIES: IS21 family transposase [Listeria]EEQ0538195.1 IS21 family transposase [Listeria innocua]EAF2199334.1 IS21 family transposase [Listeria monocytogenes]EAF2641956.1 IS21 family transposase [Listeria monocytogenes]ECR2409468.1 IS21 family transposase [Listeria monocytogenes]EDP7830469.1 IS21 family transposase [Listeria monocytogenes]